MYTLMNKDVKLLDFTIEGEGVLERLTAVKQYSSLPQWFDSIHQWVTNRSSAKHRHNVRRILNETGGNTPSGFIRLTHCLSLSDTMWVKSDNESVSWNDVSLYRNEFNDALSKSSFDGSEFHSQQLPMTSPELTTDGAFDKCWVRDEYGAYLIKAGSTGASNAGREPYSEVLASQVYERLCSYNVIYKLKSYNSRVVSRCMAFTDEKYGYKPASDFTLMGMSLPDLLNEFDKFDSADLFREMIIADAVTINQDRHFGNFGFLVDDDTFERITMAPVFDFNLAMFPYADWYEGFPDMDAWISKRGPQIGSDYYSTAQALMTPAIRCELINLKDLELEVETDDKFDAMRLKVVNKFKNIQIDRILGNRRQFSFTEYIQKKDNPLIEAAKRAIVK